MIYFKSIHTGQIYKAEFIPKFGGYEITTEQEYLNYCAKMNIEP